MYVHEVSNSFSFFYLQIGFLSRARAQIENVGKVLFDGDEDPGSGYSMSPYGSAPPNPNQSQMQQGQQGQQQRYPPQNYGGYPQGYGAPGPRSNPPYPHSGGQPPQYQSPQGMPQGPPLQSQWGQQQQAGTQGQRPPNNPGQGQFPQQPPMNRGPGQGQFPQQPPMNRGPPPQGSQQQGNAPPRQRGENPNQHPGWSSF